MIKILCSPGGILEIEKNPFISVDAPILISSKIMLQNIIGSPDSLSFIKPLKVAFCEYAKLKNKNRVINKYIFFIIIVQI